MVRPGCREEHQNDKLLAAARRYFYYRTMLAQNPVTNDAQQAMSECRAQGDTGGSHVRQIGFAHELFAVDHILTANQPLAHRFARRGQRGWDRSGLGNISANGGCDELDACAQHAIIKGLVVTRCDLVAFFALLPVTKKKADRMRRGSRTAAVRTSAAPNGACSGRDTRNPSYRARRLPSLFPASSSTRSRLNPNLIRSPFAQGFRLPTDGGGLQPPADPRVQIARTRPVPKSPFPFQGLDRQAQ